jgi:cysteinyl-tRNA synthetase
MNENDLHQTMMNQAYKIWNREENKRMTKGQFLQAVEDELGSFFRTAVVFGNFIGQVLNGGFMQWHDNGYSNSVDEIITTLEDNLKFDKVFEKVLYIMNNVKEQLEFFEECIYEADKTNSDFQETFSVCCGEELQRSLDRIDSQFYKINEKFENAFERWLNEKKNQQDN